MDFPIFGPRVRTTEDRRVDDGTSSAYRFDTAELHTKLSAYPTMLSYWPKSSTSLASSRFREFTKALKTAVRCLKS